MLSNVPWLPEGCDFEAFHCQPPKTLIEVQSLIQSLKRHFWIAAIIGRFSHHLSDLWRFEISLKSFQY